MVLYFLQEKGLLNNDTSYLANSLKSMQERHGKDRFYRFCLLPLFHEERNIPALALPLFQIHPIEQNTPHLQIADDAFRRLFAFFDTYQWRLEERKQETAQNELYPEILGGIFEQQINQKQMGAYYTQDDVTTYIARSTILPYLLHTVKTQYPEEFAPGSPLWHSLQDKPERYISSAVQNKHYLPRESKQEYEGRRARYHQLSTQLKMGQIHSIGDLITYNLDILCFVQDSIAHCEKPELLLAFYRAIEQMSILDPTCGSGAFLFATANTLEPLYTNCLNRIQNLTDKNVHRSSSNTTLDACFNEECRKSYHSILKKVEKYPTRRHFILNTILSNNLYGVDIMEEATDLCKLRLFLALTACSEKVEDVQTFSSVNWHIMPGNALMGSIYWLDIFPHIMKKGGFDVIMGNPPYIEYSKVRQEYALADYETRSYGNIYAAVVEQSLALCHPGESYLGLILPLSVCGGERFAQLRRTMTGQLAKLWLANFEIFPGRLFDGAFQRLSIVIAQHGSSGKREIHDDIHSDSSLDALNWGFSILQRETSENDVGASPCVRPLPSTLIVASTGCPQADAPTVLRETNTGKCTIYTTRIQRWYTVERPYLIDLMHYIHTQRTVKADMFPKLASPLQETILQKLVAKAEGLSIANALFPNKTEHFVYYQEATNYWMKATCAIPYYKRNGVVMEPAHGRFLYFADQRMARVLMSVLNSSLFYVWFATFSDGFHLAHGLVKDFPLGRGLYASTELEQLATRLQEDISRHARMSTRNTKEHSIELEEYQMSASKEILDEIDRLLGKYYALSDEEVEFVVNYDGKYRMGKAK